MLGERLKMLRKNRNLTQVELAKILDISQAVINRLEQNKANPGYEILLKLSAFFDVSTDYLIFGKETIQTLTEDELAILKAVRDDQSLGAKVKKWALEKKSLEYDFEHLLVA